MLNEVRRKPEKPRIRRLLDNWCCKSSDGVIGFGIEPRHAYTAWVLRQGKLNIGTVTTPVFIPPTRA